MLFVKLKILEVHIKKLKSITLGSWDLYTEIIPETQECLRLKV